MLSLFIEAVRIRNAHKRHHLVLSSESINNVNWPQKIVLKTLYNDQLTQSTQLIKPNHLLIPPPPSPEKREKNTSTQFLKKLIPSIQNKLCLHPQPPPLKNVVSHLPWEPSTKYDNMHIQLSVLPVGCKTCIILFN